MSPMAQNNKIYNTLAYLYKPNPWRIKERLLNVIYNVTTYLIKSQHERKVPPRSCFEVCDGESSLLEDYLDIGNNYWKLHQTFTQLQTKKSHHGLPIKRKMVTSCSRMDWCYFAWYLLSAKQHKSIPRVTIFLLVDMPWLILCLPQHKTIKYTTN